MEVEIRRALDTDAEEIAPLLAQLVHEPCSPAQVRARMARLSGNPLVHSIVAVLDGRVVGLASLHVEPHIHADLPAGRLMNIVVDERCRGQGIGRALVAAVVEMARAAGCDRLELTSRLARVDAHRFYESQGFEHTSKKFQKLI